MSTLDSPVTFVCVHGAWHGGWCFDHLASALETRGHTCLSMDLPIEDGTATFRDYAQAVLNTIPEDAGDVVLVGHSLGGMTIPLVAAQRPVRMLVFLNGVVPKPGGGPWDDGPEKTEPGVWDGVMTFDDGSTSMPFEAARAAFYPDCSVEDARWAFDRLRPQNSTSLWQEPYPLDTLPSIKRIYVSGMQDRVVTVPWARHVSETRLGVDPIMLPVGHSGFLSRPDLVADTLIQYAAQPARNASSVTDRQACPCI